VGFKTLSNHSNIREITLPNANIYVKITGSYWETTKMLTVMHMGVNFKMTGSHWHLKEFNTPMMMVKFDVKLTGSYWETIKMIIVARVEMLMLTSLSTHV
jgi:hypothetical protein